MSLVQGPEQRGITWIINETRLLANIIVSEYELLESEIQQLESLSEAMKSDLNELARERVFAKLNRLRRTSTDYL